MASGPDPHRFTPTDPEAEPEDYRHGDSLGDLKSTRLGLPAWGSSSTSCWCSSSSSRAADPALPSPSSVTGSVSMRAPVRPLVGCTFAAMLAGCVNNEPYHLQPDEIAAYDCGGFLFSASASLSRANITLQDGRRFSLESAGPGRGYVGDGVRLFVSQRLARLEMPGAVYSRCRRVGG